VGKLTRTLLEQDGTFWNFCYPIFIFFFFVHQHKPKARPPRSPPKKQDTSPSPTTGEVEGEWDGTTTLNNLNFRLMIVLHTVLQMRIRHYYIMKTMTLSEKGETHKKEDAGKQGQTALVSSSTPTCTMFIDAATHAQHAGSSQLAAAPGSCWWRHLVEDT